MQSGKGKELSGAIAGGNSNSYLGNTSKTSDKDKLLVRITCVLSVVLTICVLVLYVIA
jgi:protein translocase SecG subunit